MLIGAHVSPAGGLAKAIERGAERDCQSIQIFNQSPRMWRPTAYDEDDFAQFRESMKRSQIKVVLIHAVYLLNCASEDREIRTKSRTSLIQSLRVGRGIGAAGVVLHPGSATGRLAGGPNKRDSPMTRRPPNQARQHGDRVARPRPSGAQPRAGDVARAIKRAGNVIAEALSESDRCSLHLEDTAGAGGTLGRSFEELAELLDSAGGGARLGVCLDSCHLFASGYDISTADGLKQTLDDFDRVVGLKRLRSLHVNDSKTKLGSNRDRHALLGQGEIGERGLAAFLSEPRFERLPVVLETEPTADQVALGKQLRKRGQAARRRRASRASGGRPASGPSGASGASRTVQRKVG